eukprot:gnl/TRDRNA2_/TRDRNA2_172592_c1_seq4.p1 gnl/TRDRNA2_/TRDRNA2_172592_c1~~gnl/TRDRNA2_/TRDRNA2_172592_c1_seq4.p1  ORF type:complete len:561 (-),score=90.89 gnl/TRDRNA2_/TRDRNA2_172592_c1_seq4:170-1852(-)
MSNGMRQIPLDEEGGEEADRLEIPSQLYGFALWNLIIRPPRRRYDISRLGPKEFRLWSCTVKRLDFTLRNPRGMQLKCSHFVPHVKGNNDPKPVVIYLHANASCRLEALQFVPLFLPLGISLFTFDFAGTGESDGEYISLGYYERDDLAECIEYLRKTGKVSAIGLWGRSMGAVTALLHADRDHSIGGMVLDSPFCNLRQLATELAQSEYVSVKVPNWLLSGALSLVRLRLKSLCGFDIDALAPDRHVGETFVPAFFIAAREDDFVSPSHAQRLFDCYNGDKELEIVEGDHNSPRCEDVTRKAVMFLCRAFRCDPTPPSGVVDGGGRSLMGMNLLGEMDLADFSVMRRRRLEEACRLLATAGGERMWFGDRQQVFVPFRIEGALQLNSAETEAGFCVCLCPLPTEWGGANRPPVVLFTYFSGTGIYVTQATDGGTDPLGFQPGDLAPDVPMLCILEVRARPASVRLIAGTGGPELLVNLDEEYSHEVLVWPMTKNGEATFFDCAHMDLAPIGPSPAQEADGEAGPSASEPAEEATENVTPGAIPSPVAPKEEQQGSCGQQ